MKSIGIGMLVFSLLALPLANTAFADQAPAKKGPVTAPFNSGNSTHVFHKDGQGGAQQVLAKDRKDKKLIGAVRGYLFKEADRFRRGDYSDPASSNGADVPGAVYLSGIKAGQVTIVYRELRNGAEIKYTGKDKVTVDAIHNWLDAELSAAGSDATDKLPTK